MATARRVAVTSHITKAIYDAKTKEAVKHMIYNGAEWVEAKDGEKPLYVAFEGTELTRIGRLYYYTTPMESVIHVQTRNSLQTTRSNNRIIRVNENGLPINAQGHVVNISEIENHFIEQDGKPVVYDENDKQLFQINGASNNIERYYLGQGTKQLIRTYANLKNAEREKKKNQQKNEIADAKRKHPELPTKRTPFLFQPPQTQPAAGNESRTPSNPTNTQSNNANATKETRDSGTQASMQSPIGNNNNNNVNKSSKSSLAYILNPSEENNTEQKFRF